jgi:hypothetical protein
MAGEYRGPEDSGHRGGVKRVRIDFSAPAVSWASWDSVFTWGKARPAHHMERGGAILILLLWVYYSGLIFYFGAEFTKLYAARYGSRRAAAKSKQLTHAA